MRDGFKDISVLQREPKRIRKTDEYHLTISDFGWRALRIAVGEFVSFSRRMDHPKKPPRYIVPKHGKGKARGKVPTVNRKK
jgi:hypothetical protein